VRYQHNFLFVPIQDGELVIWQEGASPVPHYVFHPGEIHLWLEGKLAACAMTANRISGDRR